MESGRAFQNTGTVISIRGSVVDIRFDNISSGNQLPPIRTLLRTGKDNSIAIEVMWGGDIRNSWRYRFHYSLSLF